MPIDIDLYNVIYICMLLHTYIYISLLFLTMLEYLGQRSEQQCATKSMIKPLFFYHVISNM